jgi:hypothetical protein
MIGFVNVFLPPASGAAGTHYYTIDRSTNEILQLFKQSLIDISKCCNNGLYVYCDLSALQLDQSSAHKFMADIRQSVSSEVHELKTYQLVHRYLYLRLFDRICLRHGSNEVILYSGNHDHLLVSEDAPSYIKVYVHNNLDEISKAVFPTHYPEFIGLEDSSRAYLGFRSAGSPRVFRGNSIFSFIAARPLLLRKVFAQNSSSAFIPRIDWPLVNSKVKHLCLMPPREVFYHADGLSHIGLDNLVCLPSKSLEEYNYLISGPLHIPNAVLLQEQGYASSSQDADSLGEIIDGRTVICRLIGLSMFAERPNILSDLRYFNSFIYHRTRSNGKRCQPTIASLTQCFSMKHPMPYISNAELEIIATRFRHLLMAKPR